MTISKTLKVLLLSFLAIIWMSSDILAVNITRGEWYNFWEANRNDFNDYLLLVKDTLPAKAKKKLPQIESRHTELDEVLKAIDAAHRSKNSRLFSKKAKSLEKLKNRYVKQIKTLEKLSGDEINKAQTKIIKNTVKRLAADVEESNKTKKTMQKANKKFGEGVEDTEKVLAKNEFVIKKSAIPALKNSIAQLKFVLSKCIADPQLEKLEDYGLKSALRDIHFALNGCKKLSKRNQPPEELMAEFIKLETRFDPRVQ